MNWSVLAGHAAQLDKTTMRLAFILALLGYGTKAGLAPMHTWKPDVYSEAPVPSAALLSSATLNCALYGLIRFYILASRCAGPRLPRRVAAAVRHAVDGDLGALRASCRGISAACWRIRTIDQAGIMVIALGLGGKLGTLALMLHMTYHTVAKSLLFLCAGNISQQYKTDLFDKVKGGVIRVMPVTGAVFLMAMLAIARDASLPPFSKRISDRAGRVRIGTFLATALFILFGTGIFAGVLLHAVRLVLGTRAGKSPPPRRGRGMTRLDLSFWRRCWLCSASGCRPAYGVDQRRGAVVTGG